LVGVSASTVSKWENQLGQLTLRPENLEALTKVNAMDKEKAWDEI